MEWRFEDDNFILFDGKFVAWETWTSYNIVALLIISRYLDSVAECMLTFYSLSLGSETLITTEKRDR